MGPMDPAAGGGTPCACPGCDEDALPDGGFCPACEEGMHVGHCPRCRRVLFDLRPPACTGCGADLTALRQA